jgi:hypothetical protein
MVAETILIVDTKNAVECFILFIQLKNYKGIAR